MIHLPDFGNQTDLAISKSGSSLLRDMTQLYGRTLVRSSPGNDTDTIVGPGYGNGNYMRKWAQTCKREIERAAREEMHPVELSPDWDASSASMNLTSEHKSRL